MRIKRFYLSPMFSVLFVSFSLLSMNQNAGAQEGWYPHEGGLMKYRVNARFGEEPITMPDDWNFGVVSSVATDSKGEVYVFHRGKKADPIIVFDAEGMYLRSWGRDLFIRAHGIRVDKNDYVWIVDDKGHTVQKWTRTGELLMTLGTHGISGESDKSFNEPTDIAFAPNGDFYISDGYGNSRVVKFSAQGKFLRTWGKSGTGPGEFNTPHSIAVDSAGNVYVSDRANNRIQIFDSNGKFLRMWTHLGSAQGMFITPSDVMWIITHRNQIEISNYGSLAGRIMKIDIATGEILGAMESPGHWIDVSNAGEIFIGSLTGNVFRWSPGWMDDQGLSVDESIASRNILLVVGDENGTVAPGTSIDDVFIKNRLETVLGHNVTIIEDQAPADKMHAAAVKADLVLIAESVHSGYVGNKITSVATPVINYEAFLQDEFGLTAKEPSGDPGGPSDFAYGAKDKQTSIDIVSPEHPLAAGLKGRVKVYRVPREMNWGKVAPSAEVIATLPGDEAGKALYLYRKGAKLFDGSTAPGLRIGFFIENDNETGTANLMTDDGLRLFEAAVKFALGADATH